MANTLMMIIHIAPYRHAFLLIFRCCIPKKFMNKISTGGVWNLKQIASGSVVVVVPAKAIK